MRMARARELLSIFGFVVLLLAVRQFVLVVFMQQQQSSDSITIDIAPIVSDNSNNICCPKVFLYDPNDVLERVKNSFKSSMKLSQLDPLNTDSVVFHQYVNHSVPRHERIPLLSNVLRWLPDVPNRAITHADNLFDDSVSSGAMLFYSKDFVHSFHLRLAVSGCVVTDPNEADLFVVPFSIHTDRRHGKKKVFQEEWNNFFSKLMDFQQIFQYLTDDTASKHVIFSSSFGHSRHSVGLWNPPYNDNKVKQMQRVALGSDFLIRQSYWLNYMVQPPGNVISVPFSALLVYPQDLYNISREKDILVTSFLEIHGQAKALRVHLNEICESSSQCWSRNNIIAVQNKTRSKMQLVAMFLNAKTKSTFCFEPEGDWPTRQSMIQDVLLTCIPVFFSQSYRYLWSSFWGNFIQEASVEIDGDAVMKGEIDIFDYLKSISPSEVRRKQSLLRRHREQLLYLHMNDYMGKGNNLHHKCSIDAANLLLRQLFLRSRMNEAA